MTAVRSAQVEMFESEDGVPALCLRLDEARFLLTPALASDLGDVLARVADSAKQGT